MITQDQLKSIQQRTEALKGYLNIDDLQIEIDEEVQRTQLPEFWNRHRDHGFFPAVQILTYLPVQDPESYSHRLDW